MYNLYLQTFVDNFCHKHNAVSYMVSVRHSRISFKENAHLFFVSFGRGKKYCVKGLEGIREERIRFEVRAWNLCMFSGGWGC